VYTITTPGITPRIFCRYIFCCSWSWK